MKKVWLALFFTIVFAQAAPIANIKALEHKDSLDLLFFSTKPFTQNPKILDSQNQKIITLQGYSLQKKWEKKLNSTLKSVEIFSKDNLIYIIPKSDKPFEIKAAKSKDAHTLRLRFVPVEKLNHITALINKGSDLKSSSLYPTQNTLPLKQDDYRYWLVLGFMGILVIALLIVRKKMNVKKFWLSGTKESPAFEVILNKNIDNANKILAIQIQNSAYVVLLNNKQNLLIDKIALKNTKDNPAKSNEDFWETLRQKTNKNAR